MPLLVGYYPKDTLESLRAGGDVLGVVGFGGGAQTAATLDVPMAGGDGLYEVWRGGRTSAGRVGRVSYAEDGEWLFASVAVTTQPGVEEAAFAAYTELLAALAARGYPHLIRVWQYFSGINDEEENLERYRRFNRGRHAALKGYLARGLRRPAATAIGCAGDGFYLYALARRQAGMPIENPRQVPAFRYPPDYGPQPPDFTRAMRVNGDKAYLFISGTAAIIGHESHHAGNAAAQFDETLRNLEAILAAGGLTAPRVAAVKVYMRPGGRPPPLPQPWGDAPLLVLTSAICRAELLIEIEALVVGGI
ncbi:MAG: pteridine-dependent deoxygenase [Gammaproteobacteria bacterium]|nr:pteridine-dependent deoxygenase [Gammaproteobacteria bacterium]